MPVNLEYRGAECPHCGDPIDDDKEAGDECDGCGRPFNEHGCGHAAGDAGVEYAVTEAVGYDAEAEGGIVVEVVCKLCGAKGAAKIKLEDLMW